MPTQPTQDESPKKQVASDRKPTQTKQRDVKQVSPVVKAAPASRSEQKLGQVTEQHDSHPTPDWWLIGVTLLLVIATGGLVYYARDTARRQLRAYVFTDSTKISDPNAPSPVKATIIIKNYGQTPAYHFRCTAHVSLFDFPVLVFPDHTNEPSDGPQSKADIPPGAQFGSVVEGGILSNEDKEALSRGIKAIYVWGKVSYRDVFKKERFTTFRYMCGGDIGLYAGEMFACKEGNKAN